jgi:hypothetical protein
MNTAFDTLGTTDIVLEMRGKEKQIFPGGGGRGNRNVGRE